MSSQAGVRLLLIPSTFGWRYFLAGFLTEPATRQNYLNSLSLLKSIVSAAALSADFEP